MDTEENRFAFIYCRVASGDLKSGLAAFAAQERICRGYATERGLDVIGVFTDFGSGYTAHQLPELDAMIDRLEQGMSVVVQDISQLGRSPSLVMSARQKLDASGCCLHSVAGKLTSGPHPSAQILSAQVRP